MSDYRPVRRSASGEGRHVWLLMHVGSGNMLSTGKYTRIFSNKGDAIREGREITAQRLNPANLTSKQLAKVARRQAEQVERDRAFVPHQAVEQVAVRPAATSRPAPAKRAARTRTRTKGGGTSPRGGRS